jgi:CxxC-x17-CxxC domain-containing protein
MSEINFFAKTNFRNQERIFGIKKDDRRRHVYVIGKTGMGKSNMLENMAVQDIRNGEGVCVVDPHGEFAEKMMRAVPSERINDVIYFNPADSQYPIAFNILEAVDENKKNLVASGMMGVFKKIWPDVWSPRMEYILNNTILALLDYPGSTMLGVNRMMSDKDFRKRIYPKVKDPVVKSFWINEFDKWEDRFRKEAVAAIQNKVGQFLSSPIIRHIVGQPKSTIDMRDIMDKGKILIVNLSKGRIGEDAMRLLGGMIVTKIQLAAMGRVEIPEEKRKDFYLYVDEFQNFATESFANILSEARKYRLNLILAHQYINQLIFDGNTTVRDAIFGNVGTIVTFRTGAEDAEHLEKEFEPVFLINDIVNLSKYQIYLKLMIDGIAGDAFSAITLSPVDLSETKDNEEKVIKISRERYGRSKEEIEKKIARWSGMFSELEEEQIKSPENNEIKISDGNKKYTQKNNKEMPEVSVRNMQKIASTPKKMFEAICDTCGEKIQVPFEPDPNRPAFCKECLKDYQRAKARMRNDSGRSEVEKKQDKFDQNDREKSGRNESETEIKAFVSPEKPISLNQTRYIMPKKFIPMKKKSAVNLEEVRNLINKTKNN